MSIIKNGKNIIGVYKGDTPILKIFKHNNLVYQHSSTGGTETQYDITSTFNVTSTTSPTVLCYSSATSAFTEMYVDGVQIDVASGYAFNTTGEHTVGYTLSDKTEIGSFTFSGCTSLTEIVIPSSVTIIFNYAFEGCSSLTYIVIPDSVTTIRDGVFENCSSLTSITLPQNLSSNINRNTFAGCTSLTEIVIPDSVPSISGSAAFSGCTSLQKITIGSGVTSIGTYNIIMSYGIFTGCTSLTEITCLAPTAPTLLKKSIQGVENNGGTLYVPQGSDYSTWKAILKSWTIQYIT